MFKLVVVGTIVAFVSAHSQQGHPVHHGIVNDIKSHATTWTPMEVEENPLRKLTVEQIMGLLGTNVREPQGYRTTSAPLTDVPDTFDSRVQWPKWIHPIRDQAQCGSCWAFGATEALSDRFAIQSYGSVDVVLSPQDLVSCDSSDYGCSGGYLDHAWIYLTNTGVVSDGCFPYQSQTGSAPQCLSGACTDTHVPYTKYKCVENTMIECTTPDTIKAELFANGPMETGFDVYEDFFSYQTGVYQHVSGAYAGGHAVKMLGWGNENGVDYWLCANSWNTSWGEQGFFKIKMGDCNIDAGVYACQPDMTHVRPCFE